MTKQPKVTASFATAQPGEVVSIEQFTSGPRYLVAAKLGDLQKGEIYWIPSQRDTNVLFGGTKSWETSGEIASVLRDRIVFVYYTQENLPASPTKKRASKKTKPVVKPASVKIIPREKIAKRKAAKTTK